MPGPVSNSFDPEFGTGANAADIRREIELAAGKISLSLGIKRKYILDVVHGPEGNPFRLTFSEKELRVIRFALNRALETI